MANGFPSPYIDDGYTEQGYLRAVPGLHPDIRFTYRPMTLAVRGRMMTRGEKCKDDAERFTVQAETIVQGNLLLEWNVSDRKGAALPISVENMLKLRPRVFLALVAIIAGVEPSDVDDQAPHLAAQRSQDDIAYILHGETGDADAKNSVTG